jgi:hypothetical protein
MFLKQQEPTVLQLWFSFSGGENCNWQFFDSVNFKELLKNWILAVIKIKKPYNSDTNLPQSNEILINLGMECWNSAFNAQGWRVITLVVQVGAVKIYVAAVEALGKKETQDETQFTAKIGGKTSLGPSYFLL